MRRLRNCTVEAILVIRGIRALAVLGKVAVRGGLLVAFGQPVSLRRGVELFSSAAIGTCRSVTPNRSALFSRMTASRMVESPVTASLVAALGDGVADLSSR